MNNKFNNKTMKKIIFTLIFSILFAFAFTSCSTDEPEISTKFIETTSINMIDLKCTCYFSANLGQVNENETKYVLQLPFHTDNDNFSYNDSYIHIDQNNLSMFYLSMETATDIKLSGDNLYLDIDYYGHNNPQQYERKDLDMYIEYEINENDTIMTITEATTNLPELIYKFYILKDEKFIERHNYLSSEPDRSYIYQVYTLKDFSKLKNVIGKYCK